MTWKDRNFSHPFYMHQLIVATHSDRLIRFLEPKEVLVCDAEDGLTTLNWADTALFS